jgi:hypothetical protein
MFRSLLTLILVCGILKEANCLVKNIKSGSQRHQVNANDTITARDLFARQSCDPGYGLCGKCPHEEVASTRLTEE